ncbi:MAG: PQQ-dependent sugar dehydrogenase [Planctomycetaceae bacterium]|nr:PQQ-dependent sugar dehydrogenase [Planctomycetaceae bacterium]
MKVSGLILCCVALMSTLAVADDSPKEADYYPLVQFQIPDGVVLEGSSCQMMPDGKLAVASRRGEIWMVTDPFTPEVKPAQFKRFASGLHEVLSMAEKDGWLYIVQRTDVSRLKDTNGDGEADQFEIVNGDWEVSADYHEYAFGSKFDANGDLWVTLCLTGSFSSAVKYRGWCVRITPEGELVPTCSGIRSPGGMGANAAGDIFYTDNQGPWNGTCELKHLIPGKFMGHPGGWKWYEEPAAVAAMGKQPQEPLSGSRFMTEAKKIPEYEPPCILFPYKKMGQSASGICCDTTGGKFGPFQNQLFVGDVTFSTIMRVDLEQVQGHYQGACFPFREGLASGTLGLEMTPQGAMFVAETNRGWGSRGNKPFAVERLNWTGKTPFEILHMKAVPSGFELEFTEPVDPATASDPKSYEIQTYTYIYQSSYGSPEVDHTQPKITSLKVSEDNRKVTLLLDAVQEGHVHELHANGVRSASNLPLLHKEAYYTLNYLP